MTTIPYKIVVVGDAGTGKTTFLTRLMTGKCEKTCIPTVGAQVRPYTLYTQTFPPGFSFGPIPIQPVQFEVWDCAGQEEFYYLNARAALVFVDKALPIAERMGQIKKWITRIQRVAGNIPVFAVHNKWDTQKKHVLLHPAFKEKCMLGMSALSSYANYGLDRPFLFFARRITGNAKLLQVEAPPIVIPIALSVVTLPITAFGVECTFSTKLIQ